jgi:RNA polymerase sigma factor (TIGR02999 family)
MKTTAEFTTLMSRFRRGDPEAADALIEALYPELRRLAAHRMKNERSAQTWQPTVLVNELYLELRKVKQWRDAAESDPANDREAFLALAAFLMRRLLSHHARPVRKRSDHVEWETRLDLPASGTESLQEIESILTSLAGIDPRLRQVVELKVFEGISLEEIADRLDCSLRTVARHWSFAKMWLGDALRRGDRAHAAR